MISRKGGQRWRVACFVVAARANAAENAGRLTSAGVCTKSNPRALLGANELCRTASTS